VLDNIRIAIVGAGRLGAGIADALQTAGVRVSGPLGRGADGMGCEVVLLCVPDAEIARAARCITPGPLVGHTSGVTSLEPLAPHEAFSIHPLLSMGRLSTGKHTAFAGAGCAIAGATPRAREMAAAIAGVLGMHPYAIAESDRALYHAAASMAANYLVTLEGAAEQLSALVGVHREHLVPLVRSAVDQWSDLGARDALTGPVARGDEQTVARQREAISARRPELLPVWDALTDATRALSRQPVGGMQ
jgi:predicted short-subunit dehydrogenase-like oxidoreductase (DUF2520 family)